MPQSTEGVYIRNGRFLDYYNNPIDIGGSIGSTGATGANGQDLLFVSGGTGTVERVVSNVFIANDSSVPTSTVNDLDIGPFFITPGQIVKFRSDMNTEDGTGDILSGRIYVEYQFSSSTSTVLLFQATSDVSEQGLFPAKIKFDRDPNLPATPSGYQSNEKINLISSEFECSYDGFGIQINATIYGYDTEYQQTFGLSRFPQKIWKLSAGFAYTVGDPFVIRHTITPDGAGATIGIRNILRYNAY